MDARQQRIQELRSLIATRKGRALEDEQQSQQSQPDQQQGMGSKVLDYAANNPLTNMILGAGDAPQKFGMNLTGHKFIPSSEGKAYEAGNLGGNLAMMLALSELGGVGASRLGSEGIAGNIAKLMQSQSKFAGNARNIGAGAAIGAVENPEDRMQGALEGGGGAAALTMGLGAGTKSLQKGLEYINAPKFAREMYGKLRGGRSLQEDAKQFSELVREGRQKALDTYKGYVDPVMKKFGNERVFRPTDLNRFAGSSLQNSHLYDSDVKQKLSEFLQKGNLNSANELKKQIGQEMGGLQLSSHRGNLDTMGVDRLKHYKKLYDELKGSISNFIERRDPESALKWKIGSNIYKNKVVPYSSDPQLRLIALGKEKNPGNFHEIFKHPERQMETVLSDIGEEGKKKIAHSHIGVVPERLEVDRLKDSILDMGGKAGLESSIPKGLKKEALELDKRDRAMNRTLLFAPMVRRRYFRPI